MAYTYAEINRELDEAELLARWALSLKSNNGYIQDTLGWIMFKQGHIENSIKLLESAYKIESDERVIAEHLGDAYHIVVVVETPATSSQSGGLSAAQSSLLFVSSSIQVPIALFRAKASSV